MVELKSKAKFWGFTFIVVNWVYTSIFVSFLFSLLWNTDVSDEFQKVAELFDSPGMQLGGVVKFSLWLCTLILIMQAHLHAYISADLCFEAENITQGGLHFRLSIAYCIRSLAVCCLLMEVILFGLMFNFYFSQLIFCMIMSHFNSALMISCYIRNLRIVENAMQRTYLLVNV